jgi:hypothetical protein
MFCSFVSIECDQLLKAASKGRADEIVALLAEGANIECKNRVRGLGLVILMSSVRVLWSDVSFNLTLTSFYAIWSLWRRLFLFCVPNMVCVSGLSRGLRIHTYFSCNLLFCIYFHQFTCGIAVSFLHFTCCWWWQCVGICKFDSQHGWTALIGAAHECQADCVRLLIDAGADKDAKDNVRARSLLYLCIICTFYTLCLFMSLAVFVSFSFQTVS